MSPTRTTENALIRNGATTGAFFVFGAGAAFATSGPLARYAEPADPIWIVGGRTALAALLLGLVGVRGLLATIRTLSSAQRQGVALAGTLLSVHFLLFVSGIQTTSLPAAVSLVSVEPASVVLWAWALDQIQPTRRELGALALAVVGGLIVAQGSGVGDHRLLGDLRVVGAVIFYGLYLVMARRYVAGIPAYHYAALVYCVATLVTATIGSLTPHRAFAALPSHSLFAIAGLALFPTVIGHTAVQAAARSMSPTIVGLVSPAEVVGGLLISAVWLHAVPTRYEWFGGVLLIGSVLLALVRPNRERA